MPKVTIRVQAFLVFPWLGFSCPAVAFCAEPLPAKHFCSLANNKRTAKEVFSEFFLSFLLSVRTLDPGSMPVGADPRSAKPLLRSEQRLSARQLWTV